MMKAVFAGLVLASTVAATVPAFAQRIDIGPGGPSVDLRSRGERERDYRRDEYRRDRDSRLYREQRYNDDRSDRRERRGYGY